METILVNSENYIPAINSNSVLLPKQHVNLNRAKILLKGNYLNEFVTEEEKSIARNNLGTLNEFEIDVKIESVTNLIKSLQDVIKDLNDRINILENKSCLLLE